MDLDSFWTLFLREFNERKKIKMTKIIDVKNLVKSYKGGVKAVDKISFSVERGDFFGFLGPNGAGKTTTMRMMATLTRPTSGKVLVNGYDVTKNPDGVRRSIGFAMQSIGLDDLASAWENLQLMGTLYGMSRKQAKARAEELLEMFQLMKVADRFVGQYSGGMRRRLDVAVALMHKPQVLFLDEPTEGLDPVGRRMIWEYLNKLNKEGVTIFLTTHYMEEADFLAHNLAIINKGKIVVKGTPAELKSKIGTSYIDLELDHEAKEKAQKFICAKFSDLKCQESEDGVEVATNDGEKSLPKIINSLEKGKVAVKGFKLRSSSLEDVFLKYAGEKFIDEELNKNADPYMASRRRG